MNNKTLLALLLFFIMPIVLASSQTYTGTPTQGGFINYASTTGNATMRFSISNGSKTVIINNITIIGGGATRARLYDDNGTLLATGTVTGYDSGILPIANFNYTGTTGTIYRIVADNSGSSWDRYAWSWSGPNTNGNLTFISQTCPGDTSFTTASLCGPSQITYTIVSNDFIIKVNDTRTGQYISNFCALFTGASVASNTTTCTPSGNASTIVSSTQTGSFGTTLFNNLERYINAHKNSGNVTRSAVIGGQDVSVAPWYTRGDYCQVGYLNTGCSIASPSFSNYCIVTDELSQWCLSISMSSNQSNELEAQKCFNTIRQINASSGGYGSLTEWTVKYNNTGGTPNFDKSYTNDNAQDADDRFIISLFNYANNENFTNTTFKSAASSYAQTMCADLVHYNFVKTNKISLSNTSRNITYYPAGGGNVAASGITGTNFMYSGYYGDVALALAACGVGTSNTTYFTIAQDVIENMLSAANWTTTTGFRTPPGRAFHWSNTATPIATCDTICSPAYLDDPDGKRMTKVCTAELFYRNANRTLHPNIQEYCNEWYAAFGGTQTSYAIEWYSNGTRKSSITDAYDVNALAVHLDMTNNASNVPARIKYVGDNKYDTSKEVFYGASCQGLYNPSFLEESLGFAVATNVPITFGFNGTTTCSASSTNITIGGITVGLLSQQNNSVITTSTGNISFNVFNYNVTGNTTTTYGSGVVTIMACNMTSASDSCGASGGTLNTTAKTYESVANFQTWTLGPFNQTNYTWFNFTMMVYFQNASNDKFYTEENVSSTSGDHYLFDINAGLLRVRNEPSYDQACNNIRNNTWQRMSFIMNRTTGVMTFTNGSCTWNKNVAYLNNASATYFRVATGGGNGLIKITNLTMTVAGSDIANTTTTQQNGTMNVTVYNADTNTILTQSNGTTNGSLITYSWSGLSTGTYNWKILVSSINENRSFNNLIFSVSSTLNQSYCTQTGSINMSRSGNYTVFLYNISSNTYFNTSGNATWDGVSNITTYSFGTYSNYLILSLLNAVNGTPISSFCNNVSNGTSEQNACTSTYNQTFYNLIGNLTITYYNITNHLNTSQQWNNFNTTGAIQNKTGQGQAKINAYRLFINQSISNFNVTNGQYNNISSNNATIIYCNNGTNNVQINVQGNYTKNESINCTIYGVTNYNSTGIYDALITFQAYISVTTPLTNYSIYAYNTSINASQNKTTTNGSVTFEALQGYYLNYTLNSPSYFASEITYTPTQRFQYYNFTAYLQSSFEFHFYNESTDSQLTNATVYIQLISSVYANNYTTNNGTLLVTLLTPGDYTIRYWTDSNVPRDYYSTITTQSYNNLTLYVVDTSISNLYIANIIDQAIRPVSNATIYLMRYYVSCNCYRTVEMTRSDTNGNGVLRVVPNIIPYKLLITKGSAAVTTQPTKFTDSTNSYTINLLSNPLLSFSSLPSISRLLTFNNDTLTYTYTWNDASNIITEGCLKIEQYNSNNIATISNQCSTGATGSIIYTISDTNNTKYVATGYLETNTEFSTIYDVLTTDYNLSGVAVFGIVGILIALVLVLGFGMMSVDAGTDSVVIISTLLLLALGGIGIITATWTVLIPIIILAAIVVYKVRN